MNRRLSRLKNIDLDDHFNNRKTFYFTADGRSSVAEVLINIDIDCHGAGSLAGEIAFAEHLMATLFPNLYYETSTNGNGVHGYIVVVKGDLGDEGLNSALIVLDRWLKHELSSGKWDVENVEVKGQCPEFTWGMKKFELKTYKSGQLAKLPREALTRADELLGTTRIKVEELRRFRVPEAVKVESDASVVSEKKRPEKSAVSEKKKRTGSIAGRHFGEDELAKLNGGYLSLAKDLIGEKRLVATGRKVVTVEDLAVFLMLLRFFTNNMNADGSLPTARWREMWMALYSCGDIERGWCHHRYARMRNFLEEQGLLSWENEDFTVGVFDDAGRFVPGEAAKWTAGEELMEMMEQGGVLELVVLDEEKKEEEKSVLYGCSPQDQGGSDPKERRQQVLRRLT
jgi:hypothetical protein